MTRPNGNSDSFSFEGVDFSGAERRPLVIIGTGPAGLTAAIYAARANLNPLVIQGTQPGGQLITTTEVENFPGFPEGVPGPELMNLFERQATRFGAELRYGMVTAVDFSQRPFRIVVDRKQLLLADAVIISTGASAKYLGLENEKRLLGHGVSACATCDGAFFRDQEVAVVGGGDSALEEALFLTRFAKRVYLIHRRDKMRASKIMQERATSNKKITFVWNTIVKDVLGQDTVEGIRTRNLVTGKTTDIPVEGLFLAIGHDPNTKIFQRRLERDEEGYIQTLPGSTHTSIPGVFASGDVGDRVYQQAITAAGDGARAAMDAERWLAEHSAADGIQSEAEILETETLKG